MMANPVPGCIQADLTLHVCDGVLYFGTGSAAASRWDGDFDKFLSQSWVHERSRIFVVGTAENAKLITRLYNTRLQHQQSFSIMLGSPRHCRAAASVVADDVPNIFREMLAMEYAPSVGGWHEMSRAEYPAYAMIAECRRACGGVTDHALQLLRSHPAYRSLAFIPSVVWPSAVRLLCEIGDPRWHVCPRAPDSMQGLAKHLQVRALDGIADYLAAEPSARPGDSLPGTTIHTWCGGQRAGDTQDVGPRDFLWRLVHTAVTLRQKPLVVAWRLATQRFLRFLCGTWLDNLTATREYTWVRESLGVAGRKYNRSTHRKRLQPAKCYATTLFVPEYFFDTKDEYAAWMQHVQDFPL